MEDIVIVDTAMLKEISHDALNGIFRTGKAFEELNGLLGASAGYWQGEGHDRMLYSHGIRRDDYERSLLELQHFVEDLQKIGGVYEQAEWDNRDTAGRLGEGIL